MWSVYTHFTLTPYHACTKDLFLMWLEALVFLATSLYPEPGEKLSLFLCLLLQYLTVNQVKHQYHKQEKMWSLMLKIRRLVFES